MISRRDVIRIRIPFPDILSGLALDTHMYICRKSDDCKKQFVKVQTLKPYMLINTPMIHFIDESPDLSRNIVGKSLFPHIFRHAFVSNLANAGLPDDLIMSILQWKSAEMLKIYKHVNEDDIFSMYFDENGIKQVEKKSLADL